MTLRAFGHPLHSMLVHFPLGLLLCGVLWDIVAFFAPEFASVARWTLIAGLVSALIAGLFGFVDWSDLEANGRVRRLANRHLVLVSLALLPFLVSVWLRAELGLWAALACDAVGAGLLLLGAWHGAELVYAHGIGTRKP
jgi:uncharacterized membrane protein